MKRSLRTFLFFPVIALAMLLCGCVFFNTYYNAEKAYQQALSMRQARLSKNPDDTVAVSPDEKIKFERAITKCSKLLELYPDRLDYAPKALFLMAESYLLEQEYDKAVEKYDELGRYYPKAPQIPLAEVHRARALYLEGQVLKARTSVGEILNRNPKGEILREAMLLAAKMEVEGDSASVGLAYYEKILQEQDLSAESRADIHWEAAKLAFDLGLWEKARGHALCEERKILPDQTQYRNEKLALLCLYGEKKYQQGIDEAKMLFRKRGYFRFQPELQLLMARGYEGKGDWKSAEDLYRILFKTPPKNGITAEAFYRMGVHFLDVTRQDDSAKAYFDSASACGQSFDFAQQGAEKSRALARIADLKKSPPDSTRPHYEEFMIGEVFFFDLSKIDSALSRFDQIVASKILDSTHTVRAAYARAYIRSEYQKDTALGNEQYRYVMQKFPNTEWAKQAEKNLGLKPTVLTDEDKAHALFMAAEKLRFDGADMAGKVIPAYREVYRQYPRSQPAAQALFITAFLREDLGHRAGSPHSILDSAKVAYRDVSQKFPNTVYGQKSAQKIEKLSFNDSASTAKSDSAKVSPQNNASSTEPAPADTTEEEGKNKKEAIDEY